MNISFWLLLFGITVVCWR